jgi:hypothetical protein
MQLSPLEIALLGGMFTTAGIFLGKYLSSSNCEKCGIDKLRVDIRIQSYIVRRLAEKSGLTQEELIEIEAIARQTNGVRL